MLLSKENKAKLKKKGFSLKDFKLNFAFLLMVLPGVIWLFVFRYLPMFGIVIAFKNFRFHPDGFIKSIMNSKWVGFKNFEFLFSTEDAWQITRNTVGYNLIFIFLGLVLSVAMAIMLNELLNKKMAKFYQTCMFLPHFLSWVVVSYFVYGFLSADKGVLNNVLANFGIDRIQWYAESKWWPYILVFMSQWKGIGYSSVVYLAAISGIDKTYYEAAYIEGANKWQQIRYITLPHLKPMMLILTTLAIGGIFRADFGLFYQVPMNSGPLYPVTNVIDTYIYRGLMATGDIGMSTAAGLYQSVVGFVLIMLTNHIVKKIDKENSLY